MCFQTSIFCISLNTDLRCKLATDLCSKFCIFIFKICVERFLYSFVFLFSIFVLKVLVLSLWKDNSPPIRAIQLIKCILDWMIFSTDVPDLHSFHLPCRIITMGQAFCCIQVDQSNVAIKEQFGKFDEVLEPGCHCLPWCFGSQLAGHLSLRVQQLDVRCETKTKVCCIFTSIVTGFRQTKVC